MEWIVHSEIISGLVSNCFCTLNGHSLHRANWIGLPIIVAVLLQLH
jgi:hypothetical protein